MPPTCRRCRRRLPPRRYRRTRRHRRRRRLTRPARDAAENRSADRGSEPMARARRRRLRRRRTASSSPTFCPESSPSVSLTTTPIQATIQPIRVRITAIQTYRLQGNPGPTINKNDDDND